MKLTLNFSLPLIGLVKIVTNSETGTYDKLFVNGEDLTENGDVEMMVAEAIGQERYIMSMYSAQYETNGVFKQQESA